MLLSGDEMRAPGLGVDVSLFYIDSANWVPFIPDNTAPGVYGWDGVFRAASIIFFAYVGFEAVSTAALGALWEGERRHNDAHESLLKST